MAKIKVNGAAEHEYQADQCEVTLTVQTRKDTSDKASKSVSKLVEAILERLGQLGIKPEDIQVISDNISERSRYDSDDTSYKSERSICFCIPADVKAVNLIREIIEDGFEDVALDTKYFLSNEKEVLRRLLKEAVEDSRARADVFAHAAGKEIVGIHTANVDGADCDEIWEERERGILMKEASSYELSDRMKPEKITLNAEVSITWIMA